MACEVKTFAKILNLKNVQEYFGFSEDDSWLSSINYGISSTGELIAIGHGRKLALLTASWDNTTQTTLYSLSWSDEIEDSNHVITSVICMPFYGKHANSGIEWTCVALGLSSGMVAFYTDEGIKIFSQSYHDFPVLAIKAITPRWDSESDSFLHVIYDQCVCYLKGTDLFPILNYLKSKINRNLHRPANSEEAASSMESPDSIQFQKFKFSREREMLVNDAVVAGYQQTIAYDHIIEHGLSCGCYAKVPVSPVQKSLLLGVGADPYLGFYYAEEGYQVFSLGDVAKEVIGLAYKNFLGGLFRSNAPAATQVDDASSARDSTMRTRCRLFDGKRDGYKVWISPDNKVAAIADNLDRVILVDCVRGVGLRVWKGYSNAQCAFVTVKESKLKGDKSKTRNALFLIIYAPRLGCLEVWALQNGPKVATFNVSKYGQLVYNNHGIFAVPPGSIVKAKLNACMFIEPSDGTLKEINIPFHFALNQTNSKTSRDIHLMRHLKILLRDNLDASEDRCKEIDIFCSEFQTEVRFQCLEMLTKKKNIQPKVFRSVVYALSKSFENQTKDKLEPDNENLKQLIDNYKRLVDFYIAMKEPVKKNLDKKISLSDRDLETVKEIVELLSKYQSKTTEEGIPPLKVTFEGNQKHYGDFIDYLSIFLLGNSTIKLDNEKSSSFGCVSEYLFRDFFGNGLCLEQFKNAAKESTIHSKDLLILVLNYWLEKPFLYKSCAEVIEDMSFLAAVIYAICEISEEEVNSSYNSISQWWQDVRELLLESSRPLGLLVAIICKTVATEINKKDILCDGNSETEDEDTWEYISNEEAQWALLIGKLDDVAVFEAIVGYVNISTSYTQNIKTLSP